MYLTKLRVSVQVPTGTIDERYRDGA